MAGLQQGQWQGGRQAEQNGKVRRLLDTLTDNQREVLIFRVIVGLSVEETAQATSLTPGSVRVTQHRALHKLRAQLTAHT
jgi:RNA polymerase sigma-70 factor, ECF subfamily